MSQSKLKKCDTETLTELQETLTHCIARVLDDDMPTDVGKTVASLASVKIAGERLKLRYSMIRKEKPHSDFLEG